MLDKEILEKLSYKCGCPLDTREAIGVVNGVCPTHPENKLLVEGVPIDAYKAFVKSKNKKLNRKSTSII